MNTYEFGSRLRELRQKSGLSANTIALRAGVPRTVYYQYERGMWEPKLSRFLDLCSALGVTPNEFLTVV